MLQPIYFYVSTLDDIPHWYVLSHVYQMVS